METKDYQINDKKKDLKTEIKLSLKFLKENPLKSILFLIFNIVWIGWPIFFILIEIKQEQWAKWGSTILSLISIMITFLIFLFTIYINKKIREKNNIFDKELKEILIGIQTILQQNFKQEIKNVKEENLVLDKVKELQLDTEKNQKEAKKINQEIEKK